MPKKQFLSLERKHQYKKSLGCKQVCVCVLRDCASVCLPEKKFLSLERKHQYKQSLDCSQECVILYSEMCVLRHAICKNNIGAPKMQYDFDWKYSTKFSQYFFFYVVPCLYIVITLNHFDSYLNQFCTLFHGFF